MAEIIESDLWQSATAKARELGFLDMRAAPAGPVKRAEAVKHWVASGHQADMHWYERSLEKRLDPRKAIPNAKSVIMLSFPYNPEPCHLAGYSIARYACGDDYHDVVLKKLRIIDDYLHQEFPQASHRSYVDTGPILERYWAEQAGLGWIGKNGNLISRKDGSFLFLASILTSLQVPYSQPHDPFCGSCRACLDACPTDAFYADGLLDSRKCISYLNIEHRGPFQEAPEFEGWLFGCDICQEVCPWTDKFSDGPVIDEFQARETYSKVSPDEIRQMEQADFSALFRKSPIKRTKMAGLKRNLEHLKPTKKTENS